MVKCLCALNIELIHDTRLITTTELIWQEFITGMLKEDKD
jgi:hypothetical protein